jgi:hypothetical protein
MWGIILHHGTACVKPGIVSPPAAEGGKRGIVSPPAAESVKRGIVSPPAAEGGGRRCDPFLLAAKTTSRVGTAARVNNRRPVKSHRVHPSSRRQEGIASRYGGYRRRIEKRSPTTTHRCQLCSSGGIPARSRSRRARRQRCVGAGGSHRNRRPHLRHVLLGANALQIHITSSIAKIQRLSADPHDHASDHEVEDSSVSGVL